MVADDPKSLDPLAEPVPRDGSETEFDLGLEVVRDRGERKRFIARGAYLFAILLGTVVLALGAYAGWSYLNRPTTAPDVVGKSRAAAEVNLLQRGMEVGAVVYRAGDFEKDVVLSQSPAAGAPMPVGGSVDLVVSAGPGTTQVPEVVGLGFDLAAGRLEMAGIPFDIDYELSNESSGTVLAVDPPENTALRPGDSVVLVLALDAISARQVLPFELAGLSVAIQPGELPSTQRDITLAVANRLGGLLEISGVDVLYTRDRLTTAEELSPERMATRIDAASPDILVVIDADASVDGGVRITYGAGSIEDSSTANADATERARRIADVTARGLAEYDVHVMPVQEDSSAHSGGGTRPWIVVSVGSYRNNLDIHRWSQEGFIGEIARPIYLGIARSQDAALKP